MINYAAGIPASLALNLVLTGFIVVVAWILYYAVFGVPLDISESVVRLYCILWLPTYIGTVYSFNKLDMEAKL